MLTARELAMAGMKVTILEKTQPGRESSWAGGGILSPLYPWRYPDSVNELAVRGQQVYPSLCESLTEKSGIDPQYITCGLMILDLPDQPVMQSWVDSFGSQMELIDATRAKQLEPELGIEVAEAAWCPQVAQIRNPRLARSLRATLETMGVEIRCDCPAEGWVIESGKIRAVKTVHGNLEADYFTVASGAWSSGLLESTGIHIPVEPVRGQMILFKAPAGLVSRITLYKGRYVIPRRDGRVLVGSTLEYVGFDKHTTEDALHELKASACELIPAFESVPIEYHWAGLRPGSPDGIPLIGAHPQISNLFINCGHFRNGVVLGPASATLCADLLLERATSLDASAYMPKNS